MNSRLLPQNKALFGLNHFCTKIHANDPGTFVKNEGYYFEEEVKVNFLRPKNGGENGEQMAFHCSEYTALQRALCMPSSL